MIRGLAGGLLALALGGCLPENDARHGLSAYDLDESDLALEGYSPVSYVDEGNAARGSPEFSLTSRGIRYQFTSAEQRARFAADPSRYEPAFGGWCAYGISHGIRWDPDPENFEVVDGRLLLFSRSNGADARKLWDREPDRDALLARAEEYWNAILEE